MTRRTYAMGSINEAKEFIKKYKEVEEFPIYGNTGIYINTLQSTPKKRSLRRF